MAVSETITRVNQCISALSTYDPNTEKKVPISVQCYDPGVEKVVAIGTPCATEGEEIILSARRMELEQKEADLAVLTGEVGVEINRLTTWTPPC